MFCCVLCAHQMTALLQKLTWSAISVLFVMAFPFACSSSCSFLVIVSLLLYECTSAVAVQGHSVTAVCDA